jgi:hypothetical protein
MRRREMKNLFTKLFIALFVLAATPNLSFASTPSTMPFLQAACNVCPVWKVLGQRYVDHYYTLAPGPVHIFLRGGGRTDLDLEVYDSRGNLVDSSKGNRDNEEVAINVYWGGVFTVRVINLGEDSNSYQILFR